VQGAANGVLAQYGIRIGKRINTGFLGAAGWLDEPTTAEGKAAHAALLKDYNATKAVVKISTDPAEAAVSDLLYRTRQAMETTHYNQQVGMGRAFPAMLPRLGPVFSVTLVDDAGERNEVYIIPREDLVDFAGDFTDDTGESDERAAENLFDAVMKVAKTPRYNLFDLRAIAPRTTSLSFDEALTAAARVAGLSKTAVLQLPGLYDAFKANLVPRFHEIASLVDNGMRSRVKGSPEIGTFSMLRTRNEHIVVYFAVWTTCELLMDDFSAFPQMQDSYIGRMALISSLIDQHGARSPATRKAIEDFKPVEQTWVDTIKSMWPGAGVEIPNDLFLQGQLRTLSMSLRDFYLDTCMALGESVDIGGISTETHSFVSAFMRGCLAIMSRWVLDAIDLFNFANTFGFTVTDLHLTNFGLTTSQVAFNPNASSAVYPGVAVGKATMPRPRIVLRDLGFFEVGKVPNMTMDYAAMEDSSLAGFRRYSGRSRRSR
jgi:hypothetical protein